MTTTIKEIEDDHLIGFYDLYITDVKNANVLLWEDDQPLACNKPEEDFSALFTLTQAELIQLRDQINIALQQHHECYPTILPLTHKPTQELVATLQQ